VRPLPSTALALSLAIASILALGPAEVGAQLGPRLIGSPEPRDELKSERQREIVAGLARRHLGMPVLGRSLSELETLQRLIDGRWVSREDAFTQQCLGVVLGDLMVANLGLSWVVVDDDYGHSRALRYPGTDELFFPITMIPKRMKAGESVRIDALYALVADRVRVLDARR